MKKYLSKTVISVLSVTTILGCVSPILASTSVTGSSSTESKIVMPGEVKENIRYSLSELEKENPLFLDYLMKSYAEDLYIIIDNDNADIDIKLYTLIEQYGQDWKTKLEDYYTDIYLEVRFDEEIGFITLEQETKDGNTYVKGKVADNVTKVELTHPNGSTTAIYEFVDHKFTIPIPEMLSATPQYVTLKAYVKDRTTPIETERVKINEGTVVEENVIVHTLGSYSETKGEVKIQGVVNSSVDQVFVTYGEVRKEVDVETLWNNVGSFKETFKVESKVTTKALVEAYEDGVKVDSEEVEIENAAVPVPEAKQYTIKGTATFSAKQKVVSIKGSINHTGSDNQSKLTLLVVAPDGKKHEVTLKGKNEFEGTISFKDRSFSSKVVRLELYSEGKLLAQSDVSYGTPVNILLPKPTKPAIVLPHNDKAKGHGKDKHKDKGKGKHQGHDDNKHDEDEDERDDD